MALGSRLELRQSQTLVMTPQLQQAIKLLQMSNIELDSFVDQEVEQNPLLERDEAEASHDADGEPGTGAADEARDAAADHGDEPPEVPDSAELAISETLPEVDSAALDTDYENVWEAESPSDATTGPPDGDASHWNLTGSGGLGSEATDFNTLAAHEMTLREHLLRQINVDLSDPIDTMIAARMIEHLDDAGYMTGDAAQIAEALGCTYERVMGTLEMLQRFDPPGIFATTLAECLELQLRDRNRFDPAMAALLSRLDLLAKHDFAQLRRICGVDSEDLAEMVREIKALNPKPSSTFDTVVAQPITPDVLARPSEDGGWIIELNPETLPRVLVNNRYYAMVSKKARGKHEKAFMIEAYQSANWLVKSLQQRAETILKVATELVRRQEGFFSNGVEHLKPLTLRDVAEAVQVHESTVSRVTSNKYIGVARGVFELKYFFTSAIASTGGGDAHSAEAIRFRIRALIDQESPDMVLSDDKLVELLRGAGVDIARRTVAKYRESMQIPSSVRRRREKALSA